jgi:hypothetical protein
VPNRISPQMEAGICRAYQETSSSIKVAKAFGVNKSCVLSTLRRNGLPFKRGWAGRFEMDDETLAVVRERYERGESIKDLSIELGAPWNVVHGRLEAAGVRIRTRSQARRRHTLNDGVFDAVTEDSAYWVGFLMADGHISVIATTSANAIELALAIRDKEHIRKFLDFLGSDHPIGERDAGNGHGNIVARTKICSDRLVRAIARYGVTPNKTHTAEVRHLELNRDFWRGVIDGDGWITLREDGSPTIGLIGSERLVSQFQAFVRSFTSECTASICRKSCVFSLRISQRSVTREILRTLYSDCKTALDRKKAIADSLLADPDNFRDRRAKWKHLTLEVLEEQHRRLGGWKPVAAMHGIPVVNLATHRVRLRKVAAKSVV